MDTIFASFFWGPRQEDANECADRLSRFFGELRAITPVFAMWTRVGGRSEPARRSPIEKPILSEWFARSVLRTDIGSHPMPEGGFTLSFLTRYEPERDISLTVSCGVYSKWVPNVCSMRFPNAGKAARETLQLPVLVKIAKAAVTCWQPDRGVISSHEAREKLSSPIGAPVGGWITYLPAKYARLAVPPGGASESVRDGRLIIATPDRFSSANPTHMRFARELTRMLQSE